MCMMLMIMVIPNTEQKNYKNRKKKVFPSFIHSFISIQNQSKRGCRYTIDNKDHHKVPEEFYGNFGLSLSIYVFKIGTCLYIICLGFCQ